MLYIPKIGDYLKILTDDKMKDFEAINFSECFKSTREKFFSKLSEEQNLGKVAESIYIFLTTPDAVENYIQIMQSSSSDKVRIYLTKSWFVVNRCFQTFL